MDGRDLWSSTGTIAGKVYRSLVGIEKPVSAEELYSMVKEDGKKVLMACGWLCREGNLLITEEDGKLKFKLTKAG